MYRQYDGHPSSHGEELKEFLKGFSVVNGYGAERTKVANGMGCLAAQIIKHFKEEGPGNIYLHAAGTRDCGEEYIYTVSNVKGVVHLKCQAGAMTFFGMPGSKQESMPTLYDGPVDEFDGEKAEAEQERIGKIKNDFIEAQKKA
jgi:hypothetical protein